jgi:hypothetical protein
MQAHRPCTLTTFLQHDSPEAQRAQKETTMTTFRIFESCTGTFVGRIEAHDMPAAIALFAARSGGDPEKFHALVDVQRPNAADGRSSV